MTEVQRVEAVRNGRATLKQMTGGLLDGSEDLRRACRDFLSHTDASLGDISLAADLEKQPIQKSEVRSSPKTSVISDSSKIKQRVSAKKTKPRFGLPQGFTPRLQRYGRSVLLEDNVYQLPDGQEFIPHHPSGTLGSRHLYSLLTPQQHNEGRRGSVYIRTDGRIFDYSVDHGDPEREMFDTGYTINDLERTGRYSSTPCCQKAEADRANQRRAARAG